MKDYKKLTVWVKAHELTLMVYSATKTFPSDERFGLVSQMRRAAVSIPSNIAEGCGRRSDREFAHFLNMASGSNSELEYQSTLAKDLGYVSNEVCAQIQRACSETRRMLSGFMNRLTAEG